MKKGYIGSTSGLLEYEGVLGLQAMSSLCQQGRWPISTGLPTYLPKGMVFYLPFSKSVDSSEIGTISPIHYASFNGGRVMYQDHPDLRLNGSFSVVFRIRVNSYPGGYPGFVCKDGMAGTGWGVFWTTGMAFKKNNSGFSFGDAVIGAFEHYAFTYDAGTSMYAGYQNSVLRDSGTHTFQVNSGNDNLAIGNASNSSGGVDNQGNFDLFSFRIYNRALSGAEIASLNMYDQDGVVS